MNAWYTYSIIYIRILSIDSYILGLRGYYSMLPPDDWGLRNRPIGPGMDFELYISIVRILPPVVVSGRGTTRNFIVYSTPYIVNKLPIEYTR